MESYPSPYIKFTMTIIQRNCLVSSGDISCGYNTSYDGILL